MPSAAGPRCGKPKARSRSPLGGRDFGRGCCPAAAVCWNVPASRNRWARRGTCSWPGPLASCHLLCVRLTGTAVEEFLRGLPGPRFADSAACPGAAELLARVCGADDPDDPANAAAEYGLLCALARADEEVRHLSPLVARAVQAIRDNYMALYGVEELSAQLGVSKCHLVRVFSAEMGMPPGKYLTSVRIEAAKLLLAEREYNLEMIAGLCGFSGANYLCRVFKRETGLSPAAWRETAAPKAAVQKLPARNNEIYV